MASKRRALAMSLIIISLAAAAHGKIADDNDFAAGRRAFEAGDYSAAVHILQGAAQRNPRDGEILLFLARSHFEMREFDAAIKNAEKAIALVPNNSVYHEWLGRSFGEKADRSGWFSALGLAKKARQEFERAVELDKRNFSAAQALIEYDCAAPAIAGGGEDKAQREIQELASLNASEGHYAAGNCRRQKKDFAAADAEFDRALADAKAPELIFDIGDYAAKRSQAERLRAVTDAGLRVAPGDVRIRFYQAARLIVKNERPKEAERLLRDYLGNAPMRTGYPSPAAAHVWLGRMFENESKPDAARAEYQTALKLDPKNKIAQDALKKTGKN
jgi:tetratricopeptide (TPR) repeat protein